MSPKKKTKPTLFGWMREQDETDRLRQALIGAGRNEATEKVEDKSKGQVEVEQPLDKLMAGFFPPTQPAQKQTKAQEHLPPVPYKWEAPSFIPKRKMTPQEEQYIWKLNSYRRLTPEQAKAEEKLPVESKAKDIWDAFYLSSNLMGHNLANFFSYTLPQALYPERIYKEKPTTEEMEVAWKQNKPLSPLVELSEEERKRIPEYKENEDILLRWKKKYDENEALFQSWLKRHPELQPREEWQNGVIETFQNNPSTATDPAYWAYVVARAAPFTAATLGVTMAVSTVTGNPFIGLASGGIFAAGMEGQSLHDELIAVGADEQQASQIAVALAPVLGGIEVVSDLPLLRTISKPFYNLFVKNISRELAQNLVARGLKTFALVELSEITEEIIQDVVTTAAIKTFDEGRSYLENLPETIVQTAIATAPWAMLGVGGEMARGKGVAPEIPEPPIPAAEQTAFGTKIPTVAASITPEVTPPTRIEKPLWYVTAKENTKALRNDVYQMLDENAKGIWTNTQNPIDKLFDVNASATQREQASVLYNAYNEAREVLRREFGDVITLYRAQGKARIANKNTLNFAESREWAKRFESLGDLAGTVRPIISAQVMVDNILAIQTGKGEGIYREFIVANREAGSLALPVTPPITPEVTSEIPVIDTFKLPAGLKKPLATLSTKVLETRLEKATPYAKFYQAELDRRAKLELSAEDKLKNTPIGELKPKEFIEVGVRKTVNKVTTLQDKAKNLPIEYKNKIQSIIEDFDIAFRQKRTLRKREGLVAYIKRLEKEGIEPNIPQQYIDMAFKTPLNKMTIEQLESIANQLQGLVSMGTLKNNLIRTQRIRTVDEAEQVIKDYLGYKTPEDKVISDTIFKENWWVSKISKFQGFLAGSYRVERILLALDGYRPNGVMHNLFYKPVNDATNTKFRAVQNELRELGEYIKIHDINIKNLEKIGEPLSTGETFTISEKIGILLHSKNKDNLMHLIHGNNLSIETIEEVINSLTPNEIALAEFIGSYFEKSGVEISKTRTEVEGKSLDLVKNYFPIILDQRAILSFKGQERKLIEESMQDLSSELNLEDSFRFAARSAMAQITKPFLRTRTKTAIQPIRLDALRLYVRRMEAQEHYKAFAPVIRDLSLLLNREGVQNAIIDKSNRAWLDEIKTWVKKVAETNPLGVVGEERIMRTLRVNATAAVLGLNITTMLKQFPSFLIGAAEVGNGAALKGIFTYLSHPTETRNMMKELAPQIFNRTMERELAEAKVMRSLEQSLTNKMSTREAFMLLTVTADRIVVGSLWRGAFDDYISKNPGQLAEAAEHASAAIRKTQPFFSIKDVPRYWRSNEFMRTMTMFTNQLNQYWNYYRFDIFGAAAAGQIGFSKVAKAVIEGFVLPAILIGWISRSEPPEDWKDITRDLAAMAFGTFPIAGNFLVSGLKGFYSDSGLITTELFDRVQRLTYSINQGSWDNAALLIPELAGYAAGVPVAQPKRMGEAIYNLASRKSDDWLALIWGSWTREQARKEEAKPLQPWQEPAKVPPTEQFKFMR